MTAGNDRRDYQARYRAEHRELYRDATHRWRGRNKDKITAQRVANKDEINARNRERAAADPNRSQKSRARRMRNRHGPDVVAASAAMWEEQGGKCYLCGIWLVPERAYIDHDHRCCPPDKTCAYCRRGLTCDLCNTLIGLANDDPALLRQIADNLEARLAVVNARLAEKPAQLTMDRDGAR